MNTSVSISFEGEYPFQTSTVPFYVSNFSMQLSLFGGTPTEGRCFCNISPSVWSRIPDEQLFYMNPSTLGTIHGGGFQAAKTIELELRVVNDFLSLISIMEDSFEDYIKYLVEKGGLLSKESAYQLLFAKQKQNANIYVGMASSFAFS